MMSLSFMIRIFDAVDLDFGARPLAEQHAVADLQIDRDQLAGFVAAAGADGDDFALLTAFPWRCRE